MTPQDEMAELLGLKLEPEPADESPPAQVEDDEPAAAEPEPEPAAEEDPPLAAEAEETPAVEDPEPDEGDSKSKREKALMAEIAKLRREVRTREQQDMARFAPPPTQVQVEQPKAKGPTGVPVRVSEDGSSVYVDPAELDRIVEERAARVVENRLKPTPEQLAAYEANQTMQAFVAENPARNMPIAQETSQAYQYLQVALKSALQTTGAVAQTADDLIGLAHESGVAAKFGELFPDLAPHFDELIEADVSNNAKWKSRILRRIAAQAPEDAAHAVVTPRGAPVLRSVANAPRSLAQKGGTRSAAPSVDASEFEKLEREFRADVVFFPREKRLRMEELGRKLGKSGFV